MKPWQRLSLSLSVHVALAETNGSEIGPREGEVIFTAPSCRPSSAVSMWSLPDPCWDAATSGWERTDRFRRAHWLHRFKSERTDASACPSLPGAVSLPRRRAGDGTVSPAPTGCHALAFPLPRASLRQGQTRCQGQTLPRE